jgi:uncharacterized protein DUF4349
MSMAWGSRLKQCWRSSKNLRTGWIVTCALVALYVGAVRPYEGERGINNSRATGLATDQAEPILYWRHISSGAVSGIAQSKSVAQAEMGLSAAPRAEPSPPDGNADRKMVRTAEIEMIVQHPAEVTGKIRSLANREGGSVANAELRGDRDATWATLKIRVPAERLEQTLDEIRKVGLRVESERTESQDVTRQYTDQGANLRNLKAEEQQYLLILKQAKTVKDTLDVSEKLSEVRGHIEQQQADFNALSKQVETVTIDISLRAEAEARVLGLNWRPLYQMKLGLRDGLEGVGNYFSAMTAFVFFLPTAVLWLGTIILFGAIAWKILRWTGRRWFGMKRSEAVVAHVPAN